MIETVVPAGTFYRIAASVSYTNADRCAYWSVWRKSIGEGGVVGRRSGNLGQAATPASIPTNKKNVENARSRIRVVDGMIRPRSLFRWTRTL